MTAVPTPASARTPVNLALPDSTDLRLVNDHWDSEFVRLAVEGAGRAQQDALRYARQLPVTYKQDFTPGRAVDDQTLINALRGDDVEVRLRPHPDGARDAQCVTVYSYGARTMLSDILPIFRSLDIAVVDERPHRLTRDDGESVWVYDFGVESRALSCGPAEGAAQYRAEDAGSRFCAAFIAAWTGRDEIDGFNRLVLRAGLSWSQAAVFRAYAKYLRQCGFAHGPTRIAAVLGEHPRACVFLWELFELRLRPDVADHDRPGLIDGLLVDLRAYIDAVPQLEEDHILSSYLSVVASTLRTNYFRGRDEAGSPRSEAVALKLDAASIELLPQPRPQIEVFVYSPRVEGVHLRFGKVARGGLRWSDRHDDFRTEILDLVKAQAVKNAVIVPVGAKGGFVSKRSPAPTGDPAADRRLRQDAGIACYREFIGALLDITDNLDQSTGRVTHPSGVRATDGDDPYLVVAADKGTATFSDHANALAMEYGHWLGDAFASGGSVGYDHKAMGITAKGAWESVKRHFLERGTDTQRDEFTVVGIGDMSGDVFGNGMLRSDRIRLIAAFDHRHIFLDPNPDAAVSFAERRRLFDLPGSTWADYDPTRISDGGGVFARSTKRISISAAAEAALGMAPGAGTGLRPDDLIRAILRSPVDLLWNGGVGTYVKASTEVHRDAGDKTNDAVRVDADELRVRVIGEGGNLGLTTAARIEFAAAGGGVNTDALDNSAGVDCSDHEVNIKILVDGLVSAGRIDSTRRADLLREMTGEVETLVLANNVSQNRLIGTLRHTAAARVGLHARLIRAIIDERGRSRSMEGLPTDAELRRRAQRGVGLTSPELAVLIAHVKLALKAQILDDALLNGDLVTERLISYFPRQLGEHHRDAILEHPLRREISATVVTNEVVDTAGVTFVFRLCDETGVDAVTAVRAYLTAAAIAGIPEVAGHIDSACTSAHAVDVAVSTVRAHIDRLARWLLSHRPTPLAVNAEVVRYRESYRRLTSLAAASVDGADGPAGPAVRGLLRGADSTEVADVERSLESLGVERSFAGRLAVLPAAMSAFDIRDISGLVDRDEDEVAQAYHGLAARLGITSLIEAIDDLNDEEKWASLARIALQDNVYFSLGLLVTDMLYGAGEGVGIDAAIAEWDAANRLRIERMRAVLAEITANEERDAAVFVVAVNELHRMTGMAGRTRLASA